MKRYINRKFGRLMVVANASPYFTPNGRKVYRVKCKCLCGKQVIVMIPNLMNGSTKSCGCYRAEHELRFTHRMSKTRQYKIWNQMLVRCYNSNNRSYKFYGARGIKVCNKWKHFEGFWKDMGNGYSDKLQIDRRNNNNGYFKKNCHWVTPKEQQNNRTNNKILILNGVSRTLMQWSELLKIHRGTIQSRLMRGWSTEKALITPIRKKEHTVFNPKNKEKKNELHKTEV